MNPYRRSAFALDFDRTFTADIDFWRLFIRQAVARGHTVYCVTGRVDCPRNRLELANVFGAETFQLLSSCVFCNHSPKRQRMRDLGIEIDIWIDDMPEGVGARDPATFRQIETTLQVCETLPIFKRKAVDPHAIWYPGCNTQYAGD